MNLAFPFQLGERLPGRSVSVQDGEGTLQLSAEALASVAVWDALSKQVRYTVRARLHQKVRTWWSNGNFDAWPLVMAAPLDALATLDAQAPNEWRELRTKASITDPSELAGWTLARLLEAVEFRFGTFLRLVHALEGHEIVLPPSASGGAGDAAAPPVELASEPLFTAEDLLKAIRVAGSARPNDVRLGLLLQAVAPQAATLADACEPLLDDESALKQPALATLVREALRIGALDLSADLHDIAARLVFRGHPSTHARNVTLFTQRYGGGVEDGATLQAIANLHGLTRERVRQVTERMLGRLTDRSVCSSAFARIVEALPGLAPLPEADAVQQLRPLLGPDMPLSAAFRYCTDVLGIKLPIELLSFSRLSISGRVLWRKEADDWLVAAHSEATGMIRGCGLAYLPRVAMLVEANRDAPISTVAVGRALSMIRGFAWLDTNNEWFWFGDEARQNRLVNGVRKVMAVARRPVDIEEVYAGISRMRGDRVRSVSLYPPPPWAVQALCQQLSFLKCQQWNNFYPAEDMHVEAELSASELLIYRYMEARGGIGSRRELHRTFVEGGQLNPITLALTLATSPALKQIDRGVFGLRGWPLDAKQLAKAQAEVGPDDWNSPYADVDLVPAEDGYFEWTVVLTAGNLNNHQTSVPAALVSNITPGLYQMADGEGTLRVSTAHPGSMTGVPRIAKARGWGVGARLLLRLNPQTARAQLTLDEG